MKSDIFVVINIKFLKILFKVIDRINVNDLILVCYVNRSSQIDYAASFEPPESDIQIIEHHILALFIENNSLEKRTHSEDLSRHNENLVKDLAVNSFMKH